MATDIGRVNHFINMQGIEQDIEVLEDILFELEEDPGKNLGVIDGNYWFVYQSEEVLPMDHERGSFMYYKRLKEGLERFAKGIIDWDLLINPYVPEYVTAFFKI